MNSTSGKSEGQNLLIKLAKEKAAAEGGGKRSGILGQDISKRFTMGKRPTNQSYTWRGGRNGQGKP